MGSFGILVYEGVENSEIFTGANGQRMCETSRVVVSEVERSIYVAHRYENAAMAKANIYNTYAPNVEYITRAVRRCGKDEQNASI